MASRGAFGFRSAKQSGKEESKEKMSGGPSSRPLIASSTSNPSKMSTPSSSFFSRGKHNRLKMDSLPSSVTQSPGTSTSKLQSSLHVASMKSEPATRSKIEPVRVGGLGIPASSQSTRVPAPKTGKHVRNILRRKAPIEQHTRYAHTESSASSYEQTPSENPLQTVSSPGGYGDAFPGSVFGITLPAVSSTPAPRRSSELATSSSRMASYASRNTPEALSTQNLPLPTPTFADSGSSTRRSESPGAFSRTSTPTSMSSQSPGVLTPIKAPSSRKQLSPTRSRPPVTRRKFPGIPLPEDSNILQSRGLTAVRESLTSSSSSSTVKGTERRDGSQVRSTSNRSTPISPSPPVRQSSMRRGPLSLEDHGSRRDIVKDAPEPSTTDIIGLPKSHGESYVFQSDPYTHNWSKTPPPRPSREGTPSLDLDGTFDLLQNTRTRLNLNRDISNIERAVGANASRTAIGRFPSNASSISARPSRMPSPNPIISNPIRPIRSDVLKPQDLSPVDTNADRVHSTKDPSPLSASSTKSSSRFGLFSKRTKSPLDATAYENPEKAVKKGPAAGTGHEGYGKYARRGRSGSISTSASRGRSTSTNSVGRTPISRKSSFTSRDDHEMDEFLRERLAPVVMTGGARGTDGRTSGSAHHPSSSGESGTALMWSESAPAVGASLPSQTPKHSENTARQPPNTHHLRRDHRRLPDRKAIPEYRLEKQGKDSANSSYGQPTLAARRSAHRLQFGQEVETLKIPAPIDTRAVAVSPTVDSHDHLQSVLAETDGALQLNDDVPEGREDEWLKSRNPERQIRSRSPKKWAFFQRVQASPRKPVYEIASPSNNDRTNVRELPATVSSLPESRSIPFYALLDSSEQEDSKQMGAVRVVERPHLDMGDSGLPASLSAQDVHPQREPRTSMLLPSPPRLTAEFPKVEGSTSPSVILRPREAATSAASKVHLVPSAEPKKPRLQQVGRIPRVVSKRDRPHKPPPQSFSRPFARRPTITIESSKSTATKTQAEDHVERPLLGVQTKVVASNPWGNQDSAKPTSPPLRLSESFYGTNKGEFLAFPPRFGSEASGSSSSGILDLVGTTAIVPEPGTAPNEDEVWNEYNEFLDTVKSPLLTEESKNPLETNLRKKGWAPEPLHIQKSSSATNSLSSSEKKASATHPDASAPTRPLPTSLDRSMLHVLEPPITSMTTSDLFREPDHRNQSGTITRRSSLSSGSRYSTSSIESDPDSLAGRETTQKNTISSPIAVKTHTGPLTQSSLRFDALMISRWLSFDRVLFSPAFVEAKRNRKNRVLVIDGLGNDDWSFYCAETYTDVDIFNLSPRTTSSLQTGALQLPKNYRQIQHVDLSKRFPFEKGFFTAAVFRFPAATSEDAYLDCISECMRVLRPGGYIEISILDINMVNMGNRARRALHELKYRMRVSQPDVALKSLSSSLQKMVKQSGFENLNRCVVSIPVAGRVSQSGLVDEIGSALEGLQKEASSVHDGSLVKSLAAVGRWWFSKCYEVITLPYGDLERSIWNDKALLDECERRETGFKLLLCYAQKPAEADSRSASTLNR